MAGYFAVVEKDQDSAYGVWFPDVEGCFSAADDQKDVLRNAIEALGLHLEDSDGVPASRGLDAITADKEVGEALSKGGYLIYVPLLINLGRPVRVNVSIDKGMLDAIDQAAEMRGLTRSAFIAQAARREIEDAA